ncbi:MAG: DsrE family protein [Armatimonadetes bacterium]|nr:DsrE family protein [Armatimonadota bacterium]
MASILLLVISSPNTDKALRALKSALLIKESKNNLGIFFLQEGVYGATKQQKDKNLDIINKLINEKASIYVIPSDLEERGVSKEDLLPGVIFSNYDELITFMMEKYDKTLGAF